MIWDFPTILLVLSVLSGFIVLGDIFYCRYLRKQGHEIATDKYPLVIDYARAFFPVLVIVLLIRSFIAQPYRVPTGSLEPTVMPGDFILVTEYNYGLRMPGWHKTLIKTGDPKTGQIALFRWPVNPQVNFVKRVIGMPGDKISYINKVLYINGKKQEQTLVGNATDTDGPGTPTWKVKVMEENLMGVKHKIYLCNDHVGPCADSTPHDFYNLVVPANTYFMMGDNRDNSDDSRSWGFMPESHFIGQARFVFLNWNSWTTNWSQKIQWNRTGIKL